MPAGGVEQVDKPRHHVLFGADLLDGHDIELPDDLHKQGRRARVGEFLLAEHLNVERRDANRVAAPQHPRLIGAIANAGARGLAGREREAIEPFDLEVLGKEPTA